MRKKAPREEGVEVCAEQFTYLPTPFGLKNAWAAHAAGEPYWCRCHEHNKHQHGTKVCLTWYTDAALPCPRCRPGVRATRVGYCPVWREFDGKPVMVIVHESAEDHLKGVGYGVRVLVACLEQGSSVVVKRAEEQTRFQSEHPLRQAPCDISLSLYTMWGYQQLVEWDAKQAREKKVKFNDAAELDTTTPAATGVRPELRAAMARAERIAGADVDEVTRRALARAAQPEPHANGNGKPKPKG
jgi:hypothetical protein